MKTSAVVFTTQDLAAQLLHIIGDQADYRRRVDAIASTLHGHEEITAKTALMIALASVAPQPASNWSAGR